METVTNQSVVKNPVLHTVVSYAIDEKPTPEQIRNDIEFILRERGYVNMKSFKSKPTDEQSKLLHAAELNQYIAVQHIDTDHMHIHVIANRVSKDGFLNNDSHSSARSEQAVSKIANLRGDDVVPGKFNKQFIEFAKDRRARATP